MDLATPSVTARHSNLNAEIETAGTVDVERRTWLAVLAKASLPQLEEAASRLGEAPRFRRLRATETGLVMVRGRIGGTGQPFNLGEMTMTRAALQLLDPAGAPLQTGFGHVAGRSARKAELVALFDALLQDPTGRGWITEMAVRPLAEAQVATKNARAAAVAASKVEFFTMVRGE